MSKSVAQSPKASASDLLYATSLKPVEYFTIYVFN